MSPSPGVDTGTQPQLSTGMKLSEIFTEKPGVTLGEVYWQAYAEEDRAYNGRVAFGELGPEIRAAVEKGAQAVADVAIRRRVDELDVQAAPVSPDLSCTVCANTGSPHGVPDDAYVLTPAGQARADTEAQPATVIVVRDGDGHERRYAAPNFGMLHDGTLLIGDKTEGEDLRVDAALAPGRWQDVHKDGALKDGPAPYFAQGKKLAIALDALREIRDRYEDDERGPTGQGEASRALDAIAELDL